MAFKQRRKRKRKDVTEPKTEARNTKNKPDSESKIAKSVSKPIMDPPKTTTKGKTFPPEILTENEIEALIGACSNRSLTGLRNRAMITLFLATGVRCSEALALRLVDLDLESKSKSVHVMRGKGSKDRVVGMKAGAVAIIEQWLAARRAAGIQDRAPLFCTIKTRHGSRSASKSGSSISTAYVRSALWRLGKQAGIAKRVHAHMFRHTFAADLRRRGVDIGVISKLLGHANIATTAHYLDHICPTEVINALVGVPLGFDPMATSKKGRRR